MHFPLRAGLTAALLLLVGTAARAQSIALTFPGAPASTVQNNGPGDCNNDLRVIWTATSITAATCSSLQVWVTNGQSCAQSPGTTGSDGGTDIILGTFTLSTQTTGTTDPVALRTIPGLAGVDCDTAIVDVKNAICASVQVQQSVGGTCTFITAPNLTVRYDSQPPDPPSVSLTAQDSKIIVGLTALGSQAPDVLNFQVEYALQLDDGGTPVFTSVGGNIPASNGRVTITGLINENTYLVRGYALDEVDNRSLASDVQTATPESADGFWATYKKDGGQEIGGCNAGGAAVPSAIAAVAVLAAFLRRRR